MLFSEPVTVSSLRVHETDFHKNQRIQVPARAFHALTFRFSGAITVETPTVSLLSKADNITYVPAGLPYATEILESGHMTVIHFEVVEQLPDAVPQVFRPQNVQAFQNLFATLEERFTGNPKDYMCLSLFYEILGTIQHEAQSVSQPEGSRRVAEAKYYIDKNYGTADLSVKYLADRAGVSEVYFRKEFRQRMGMTPLAYIRSVRMENAKSLLRTGYFTVSETAERCGFSTLSYFCAEFHRFSGTSPGEYLKKYNRL